MTSALFATSLRDYDVLLRLAPKAVRAAARAAAPRRHSRFRNLDARTAAAGGMPPPARAHPVDVLVEELQRAYHDTLVFFPGARHHDDGDDDAVIAAIWSPRLQQRQRFRAGLPYNCRRARRHDDDEGADDEGADDEGADDEGADLVEPNREAMLLEIARAAGDLIKSIEVVDG